ncbi:MAG: hypothetical protein WCT45_01750 [Candidatus Paceibacterota bacterium]|jgi:hypothetical protein
MIWLLSAGSALIAALPWLFLKDRRTSAPYVFAVTFVIAAILYFIFTPSLAGPFFGGFGVISLFLLCFGAVYAMISNGGGAPFGAAIVAVFVFAITGVTSSTVFRGPEYAALVGPIEVRDWKDDIQPKDPRHFRASSPENAQFMAGRAVGQATAMSGQGQQQQTMSQFQLVEDISSIQIIRGELWTIIPLDWNGFGPWSSTTPGVPGYMKVHGEDPIHPAQFIPVKSGNEMRYTPGAYWHQNLQRLVWNAQPTKVIVDTHLEIDDGEDGGKPHFVVSLAEPTIGWFGEKVVGSVIVNPVDGSGADKFYPLGQEPAWVDRVMAPHIVHDNIDYHGRYANGWWNKAWSNLNTNTATQTHFGYGSNNEPVLATGIASHSSKNGDKKPDSLLGVYYTNTRTGKTTEYRVPGGATEETCINQVNQIGEVRRDGLHGTTPQLYNVYGHLAYVVPTQNASHAFAGVAICDITNVQVIAWGKNAHDAALLFKQVLTGAGSQIAIDGSSEHTKITGRVSRVGTQMISGDTVFYFLLEGVPHLFTGPGKAEATIPVTQVGDSVSIDYINSGEDVLPIYSFKNNSVALNTTALHQEVRERAGTRIDAVRNPDDGARSKAILDKLSPAERALLEKTLKK